MTATLPPETPLTPALVHRLWRAGAIPPDRYGEALAMARDNGAWALWGRRLLLALAVGQILAAVVFFFAWNWADLPGLLKIALTLGLTVACALASRLRMRQATRRALLFAAGLLTGVTLAVFGQHFQTGADAWQLFALWAALLVPWAATRRSPALWALWLVVAEVGLAFFLDTLPRSDRPSEAVLALLPALAVAARDLAPRAVPRWLGLTALAAVLGITGALTIEAAGFPRSGMPAPWVGPAALAVALLHAGLRLWWRHHDLIALSLAAMAACTVLSTIALINTSDLLASGVLAAVLFAGAAQGLHVLHRRTSKP